MRTLTAYGIGVVIVLAVLNGIAWQVGKPPLHELKVFSAGFVLGVLGRTLRLSSTVIAGSPDFRLSGLTTTQRLRPNLALTFLTNQSFVAFAT